ncbi:lactosylceramide 4-alpha-galactosyltransferase-like [Epargyreus clarus]|uniref:lactosylceramide 4-alpha-galactosyltransferase-like n=1 Tax=Epargyreus clarus TaxID=520877 RepID=UPI003C2B34CB
MTIKSKILKKIKRRKLVVGCIIITVCLTVLNANLGGDLNFIHWGPVTNISCHYVDNNNVLPELGDGVGYKPPPRSIFFHETSCEGNLTSRQACAIESAARAHHDWYIHVLFSSPISKAALKDGSIKELQTFKNVKLMRVNIKDYAVGTPLEEFVLEGSLNKSEWRVEHTSDVLRYLTLYKWGGVYMDLDVVVARSIASLARNWAARESDQYVASGILAFSRDAVGRNIADATVRDIGSNFRGDVWYNNGPGVISRVLKDICSTTDASVMSSATCNGFEVYGPQFFYPVSYDRSKVYFKAGDLDLQNVYVYHLWNHITKKFKVQKGSPYAKLAKRYCPTIFNLYGDDFGN